MHVSAKWKIANEFARDEFAAVAGDFILRIRWL